jgi:hypothetical protein
MSAALKSINVNEKTNGGKDAIESGEPYAVALTITGSSDLLFHRWNCEAVDAKAKAAKNSKAKKTDDIESYLWRDGSGAICLPGEYLRQAIIMAAKFRQDPRSPRKSAMDLFKAGVVSLTNLASLGVQEPDYLDTRRVMVQRQGVNRTRPAMRIGWKAGFELQVLTPEYIDQHFLNEVIQMAGRLIGVGDFRPTFGRFNVTAFSVL